MPRDIEYDLDFARNAEVVDVSQKGRRFLQQVILGRQTPFAALVRNGRLKGLVDRHLLAQRVAETALAQMP